MEKQWCYFFFLLWLSYLMVSSVLMFTRGFLLTRIEQTNISTCTPYTDIPCTPNGASTLNITNGNVYTCSQEDKFMSLLRDMYTSTSVCLPQKSKVLLIVIDALRYDFMTYDPKNTNPLPFENKMPIFNELLQDASDRSRMYRFIADAPTTTLQRLKGLTTGSLPTFIDAGSNFADHNITEDNIIDQLLRHNKRIIFLGDDIWDSIYPKRFHRKFSYPGLNTWDLDTVDNGVYKHLLPEIRKNDWDMMVVHLSGVDHVGHRFGPYHSEMERKLTEMNNAIKQIVSILEEDMLLYVISDHGSTKAGDHGGDSEMELEAAMFAYSPMLPFINRKLVAGSDTVKQIDLVSTLATVLGVPIPYSSIGTVIFDSLPTSNKSQIPYSDWQYALLILWKNIQQVTTYIEQYSKQSDQFHRDKLEILDEKYKELLFRINGIRNEIQFQNLIRDAREYMEFAQQMCEDVWVQFDSFSMSRGLLLMFLTIFFGYMLIDGIPGDRLPEIFMSSFILCSYIVMLIVAFGSIICYYLNFVENLELTLFFSTGMASIFMLAMLVIQNWEMIAIYWYDSNKNRDWLGICCRIIMLLSISGLFSNSYIVEEGFVLQFLALTLIWLSVYHVGSGTPKTKSVLHWFKSQWTSTKIKLITLGVVVSVIVRASQFFWRCREEQNAWCHDVILHHKKFDKPSLKSAIKIEIIFALVGLALFVTVTRIWLRSCGNLVGFSPTITIMRYLPSVAVVCMGGYWVLHDLPKEIKTKIITSWQVDVFVWIIYTIILIAIVSLFLQPLCIYVLPKKKEKVSVYGRKNIIPQLFHHVKGLYKERNQPANNEDDTPIVCGLGTVYSATYVVLSVFVLLLVGLLLGDVTAPSAVLMYTSAVVVLAILSVMHYEKATNLVQLFDVSNTSIFCWLLLCQYFFYGTGHQPTFPNIHWAAAFVGTGGNFIHNSIPATLIGINTFGSHIMFGLTIPLLLIAPFTLYIMFPNLFRNDDRKEMRRGELILYERDGSLLSGVFILSCKYIIFYGIRMFVCMLASTIHCRHLMVWAIFAPKLIFEGLGLFVTLPAVLISYLLLIRINTRVDNLIVSLEKQCR